ncbi:hypothetical protein HMPREF9069_00585 [Atopobium sp. oral taxon 810 str. F0209]|nr:hypothetical protein HMPREF9069_00585 [Atopobium sp. oral taxon 810 str. F0209]
MCNCSVEAERLRFALLSFIPVVIIKYQLISPILSASTTHFDT